MSCAPDSDPGDGLASAGILPPLELEEESRHEIPDSIPVTGALLDADVGIVIWSAVAGGVYRIEQREPVLLVDPDVAPVPVAADWPPGGSWIEVIDGREGARIRVSLDGESVVRQTKLDVDRIIESAVRIHDVWLVAVRDPAGELSVVALSQDEGRSRPVWRPQARAEAGSSGAQRMVWLSRGTSDSTWFATVSGARIETLALNPRGRVLGSVTLDPSDQPVDESLPRWIPLRPLALSNGMGVQTVADVRSDTRLFFLFDLSTGAIRSRRMELPMSFLAADPGNARVVALLGLNSQELVVYRWWWGEPPHQQQGAEP